MKRRFVLPAALALTAHAVLFLGSGSPPTDGPVPVTTTAVFGKLPARTQVVEIVLNRDDGDETAPKIVPSYQPSREERVDGLKPGEEYVQRLQPVVLDRDGGGPGGGPVVPGIKAMPPKIDDRLLTGAQLDRPPCPRRQAGPVYPRTLKVQGLTGEVVVEFVVDEAGRVLNPRVLRSTHRDFEAPTLDAVSNWRFEPGRHHGVPVRFKMSVPVVFNLEA